MTVAWRKKLSANRVFRLTRQGFTTGIRTLLSRSADRCRYVRISSADNVANALSEGAEFSAQVRPSSWFDYRQLHVVEERGSFATSEQRSVAAVSTTIQAAASQRLRSNPARGVRLPLHYARGSATW